MRPDVGSIGSAAIIAVGSELLTPHKVDSNSLFLTERLETLGVSVRHKAVVGDDEGELGALMIHAGDRVDLVLVTGGLGATDDDRTRDALVAVLALECDEDAAIVDHIRRRFEARGLTMPEVNRRQALVPRGADVLANPRGTAPGLWVEQGDTVYVLLPGPPRELQPMFDALCENRLARRAVGGGLHRRVVKIAGRTESHVEQRVQPIYSAWREETPPIDTTILASLGQVELHLSARGARETIAPRLEAAVTALVGALEPAVFSADGSDLETVVGRLLTAQGRTVALAESCTGGLIASRLTDVPGSSAYVRAGWTVYSNDAKVEQLGVDRDVIDREGAVSESVAEALARGAARRAPADYGLGVTGIAGPGGGTPDKPVGTVWIALTRPDGETRARRLALPGERDRVKFQASQAALDLLRRALQDPA